MHTVVMLLITGPALAADTPSPARRCADAATGTEVEVCLRLAVENPDAVVEIAAALVAHVDRAQQPDRRLLDALLLLTTPDLADDGARLLGTLPDPRAAPLLLRIAESAENEEVAIAAIIALGAPPDQLPVLAEWLVDPSRPLSVRLAIVRTLGDAHRPEAADALVDALRRPRTPPTLRARIRETLAREYPDRPLPLDVPPNADGAAWLATGASVGLGYAMGAAGHFSQLELWSVGALTGGMGGATLGYGYGRAWPIEAADAAFIATVGVGSTASGLLLGLATRKEGDETLDRPLLLGLAGELVGFSLGPALAGVHQGTAPDQVEVMVFAATLGVAGEAASRFVRKEELGNPPPALWGALGLTGGLIAGEIVGPFWTPQSSQGLLLTGAVGGGLAGLLVPVGPSPQLGLRPGLIQRRGELILASSLGGAALGAVLSGPLDPANDVLFGGTTGAAFGVSVGAGFGLLVTPKHPDLTRGLALAGLVGGYGIGSYVSWVDPDPIDDRDVGFTLACAGWGALDALALARLMGADRDRQFGATLLGGSSVAIASIAGNLELDVPVPHTLSASSIGLWGGYAGAAAAELAGLDPFVLALPLSNVGLAAGGLMVSPLVGTPPLVITMADAGGVLGAALATVGSGLVSDDPDVVLASSLIGAGVGLTGGAILGTRWLRSNNRWDMAGGPRLPSLGLASLRSDRPPPVVTLMPTPMPGGAGATISVLGW